MDLQRQTDEAFVRVQAGDLGSSRGVIEVRARQVRILRGIGQAQLVFPEEFVDAADAARRVCQKRLVGDHLPRQVAGVAFRVQLVLDPEQKGPVGRESIAFAQRGRHGQRVAIHQND
ncbi:hypothetical protein [Synechococcus sp. GFB01]|uniref:hypothetical protein n=1 Tax=Synechococcus sp. GFB01 TaxID=1662190 RepID=UPI00128E6962|nr:hypothetical protein [Synechococcus sp. GFB01]